MICTIDDCLSALPVILSWILTIPKINAAPTSCVVLQPSSLV